MFCKRWTQRKGTPINRSHEFEGLNISVVQSGPIVNRKESEKMTTYVEVAEALIKAGYLSDADLDAAVLVLAHVLKTATKAKKMKAVALADEAHQREMIVQAADLITDDEAIHDYTDERVQIRTIEAAEKQLTADEAVVTAADATIVGMYDDAAAALLRAGLIDAANVDAVVKVIKKVW